MSYMTGSEKQSYKPYIPRIQNSEMVQSTNTNCNTDESQATLDEINEHVKFGFGGVI